MPPGNRANEPAPFAARSGAGGTGFVDALRAPAPAASSTAEPAASFVSRRAAYAARCSNASAVTIAPPPAHLPVPELDLDGRLRSWSSSPTGFA